MPFYSPSQPVNLRTLLTSASDRRRRTHLTTHLTSHLTRLLLCNLRAKTFRKLRRRCHLTLLSSLIYGLRRVILEHSSVFFEPGSPWTCSSPDRLVPGRFFPEASGKFCGPNFPEASGKLSGIIFPEASGSFRKTSREKFLGGEVTSLCLP